MSRFWALARVITTVAVRAAAPLFVPTYFGLAILGVILFGPNAMRSAEVTHAALSSPPASIALWAGWLLLTTPIARAVLTLPDTFVLRSMPVPRRYFLAISAAHLAVVEILWIALWARGEGALAAIAAGAGAMGAHSLVVARPSRAIEIASAAALAIAIAFSAPVPLLLAASAFAAPIGLIAAFRRAPERDSRSRRAPLPSPLVGALAAAHLISVRRGEAAVLARALLLTALGGVSAPLVARGYELLNNSSSMSILSLGVATGTLAVATSGVAAAVLRAEKSARWILDASAASGGARCLAAAIAAGLSGVIFGLIHGALMSLVTGAAPLLAARFIGLAALLGGVIGVAASWHARRSDAEGPRRGGQAIARLIGSAGAAIIVITLIGEPAIAILAAVAALVVIRSSRDAADLPEPLCAHRRHQTHDASSAAA